MSGTKRLIQELRKYGQDPGPISNDNRGYWMRTLQQLKQRPDKGCGQRSPSRRRKDFFSSDDNLDDDDVDNGRKRKRLKNRPTQHRYRDINFLPCSPDSPKEPPCLLESNVEVALDIAYFISEYVSKQAGDYDCLIGGGKSRNVSMKDLKVLFLREGRGKGWTIPNLSHALQLLFANPHWGIRLYLSNGSVVSNSMDADVDEVNFVESLTPLKPWVCRLENALLRLRLQIIYIIVAVTLTVMLGIAVWLYQKYLQRKEKEMFDLVDHILEHVEQDSQSKRKSGKKYSVQWHVRDKLILPTERRVRQHVWEKAVAWLAENESRIRVEQVRYAGEDVPAWRWIGGEDDSSSDEQTEDEEKLGSLR